jgi:hypothetical protein
MSTPLSEVLISQDEEITVLMETHREDSPEYPENPRFSSTQRIGAHDKDCCMRMSNVSDVRLINDPPLAQSPRGGPLGGY